MTRHLPFKTLENLQAEVSLPITNPQAYAVPPSLTYSLHCSSFLGLPFRILNIELVKPKKGTTMQTTGSFAYGPSWCAFGVSGWVGGVSRQVFKAIGGFFQSTPEPQITYLFKDLYKDFIIRNPEKVGSLGCR